ncbi:uncharacterized protein BDZ99DRAFT_219278 [Mytilinidion resinicola]|uniref:Uncharacterized protein n=1 Tax=Mytilinidion resinicola TaxID=574789 RepID=A0A6A6XZ43_9PEZI|nr:uncharacterized protein BDZ99DRAFT_219278 [Mytilinidion resinicola]KAF2801558.1 hypothetical protein BDZ99DRAFT_219278 [Mytilinidion resinicola]
MGGLAFATPGPNGSPPLAVPRMSPAVYQTLKSKISPILSQFFSKVATPPEAPGKTSHGDIDFLVEGPLNSSFTPNDIADALNATRHVKNGATRSYAVPHPEVPDAFVQVDTHVCPDGRLAWECFHQAYADLWQIIGVAHRSLGLTATDKGLHVRIEELEAKNRKASMQFLSDDPVRVLQFYGLDVERYDKGFEMMDELYEWVVWGRFFSREVLEAREEKANDRRRLKERDMYRKFISEWMPAHPDAGVKEKSWTRQDVLAEALKEFGKQQEYDGILHEHQIQEDEAALWQRIAAAIPKDGNGLNRALKALKIWVRFEDGQPVVRTVPKFGVQGRPLWVLVVRDEDSVLKWVGEHWEEVRALEKMRQTDERHEREAEKRLVDDLEVEEVASGEGNSEAQ